MALRRTGDKPLSETVMASISLVHICISWPQWVNLFPIIIYTMRCRYNAVNFLQNYHNGHPIARPWGRGIRCILWWLTVTYVLLQSRLCCVQNHMIVNRVMTAPIVTTQEITQAVILDTSLGLLCFMKGKQLYEFCCLRYPIGWSRWQL